MIPSLVGCGGRTVLAGVAAMKSILLIKTQFFSTELLSSGRWKVKGNFQRGASIAGSGTDAGRQGGKRGETAPV
jgi:hypothetical protein